MQAKPEFRKSERFGHDYIIKFGEDLSLSPYYAVSCNLSETGMYFKSLFEFYPGAHLFIKIDDYTLAQNQVSAKVVWCKELKNTTIFRYGVGVEFLKPDKNSGLKSSPPNSPQKKTLNKNVNHRRESVAA
jgi:Tfp pilus assembly protein PilZ